jgi:hypothetical protein
MIFEEYLDAYFKNTWLKKDWDVQLQRWRRLEQRDVSTQLWCVIYVTM